jgi:adenine deaminase
VDVYIKKGKFLYIDRKRAGEIQAEESIDASGLYMIPGLIDIHMHVESSLVTPAAFGAYTVRNGLTTVVAEPHEIANVFGREGIEAMIRSGRDVPCDMYFAIPANVPVTGEQFETSGAAISCKDMLDLKKTDGIICLGEVMNYRQIIQENDSEVARFIAQVHEEDPWYVLEGHCPQLKDAELARYLYLGIGSDHCEHDLEEVRQRFENGMFVQIQDMMMRQEILDFIRENNLYERFSFVTDDTFPDILTQKGHLDYLVRKAVAMGMRPEDAIYSATYTPAIRMRLTDRGLIAPGKIADFLLIDDPAKLNILQTYKRGKKVFDISETEPDQNIYSLGEQFENSVRIERPTEETFKVTIPGFDRRVLVRVMRIWRDTNKVMPTLVEMEVRDGILQWQKSGCALTMVFERHGKNGHIAYGFACGDCLKQGAVASSLSHDSHNLIVMGRNEADMKLAVDALIERQGGIIAVKDGEIKGLLELPVAGIMSNRSVEEAGRQFSAIRKAFDEQGYIHHNNVMNFCLLSLTCVAKLKLTDCGYLDTEMMKIRPLYEEIER